VLNVSFTTSPTGNLPPTAAFSSSCTQLTCALDATASTDEDGTITSYAWTFGDSTTGSGVTPSHTYAAAGTYSVTLTVRDDDGATDAITRSVSVSQATGSPPTFVAKASVNANTTTFRLTVPAAVQPGDGLLLFLTINTEQAIGSPAGVTGWQQVGGLTGSAIVTQIWKKVAASGDAGREVSVSFPSFTKGAFALLAYRGVTPSVVTAVNSALESVSRQQHTTPTVTVSAPSSVLVSYWAEKSSATTAWTPPGGVVARDDSMGSGSGRIASLLGDSGGGVPVGTAGGLVATADSASQRATMWSLVLAPAG
jgi:PKD repeat protein